MMIVVIFFVPGKSFFMVCITFITKDIWRGTLITYAANQLSIIVLFYLTKSLLRQKFIKKYEKDVKFVIMNDMVWNNPWKASLLCWNMYVMVGLKAIILALTPIKFFQYFIGSLPFELMLAYLMACIGFEMKNLGDSSHSTFDFKHYSWSQFIQFGLSCFFLTFTIFVAVFFILYFRRKIKQLKTTDVDQITEVAQSEFLSNSSRVFE